MIPQPTLPNINPLLEDNWFGQAPNNTQGSTLYTYRIDHRFSDKDRSMCVTIMASAHEVLPGANAMPTTDNIGVLGQ